MFQEIFDKIKAADGTILGSPVYSANVSANMQAFLERAAVVADMNPGLLKHKVGGSVVGSTYWNMAYGQMPGDVLKDEEGLNNIKNLGENMVFLLKQLNLDK